MKLSAAFVIIAAAFTGSANAAEITNGNLRATSLANAEVFEEPSKIEQLDGCVAECIVGLKKPSKKEVLKMDKKDITGLMEACSNTCFDDVAGDNQAVRSALESQLDPKCAAQCAKSAFKKFKTVDNDCDNTKKCKKCNRSDEVDNPDEYEECMDEYEKCNDCQKQIEKAQSSMEKVTKAMVNCAPACTLDIGPDTDEVFEEPSGAVAGFENCVLDVCKLKKPKDKDAQQIKEEDLEHFFGECVNSCYGPDDASRAAVERAFPPPCAEACAAEAGGELKEVSRSCSSKNDINCKKCNEEDDDYDKCEKKYKECQKCEDEVNDAQKSVKKASEKLFKCLPMCNPEYQTYIELA